MLHFSAEFQDRGFVAIDELLTPSRTDDLLSHFQPQTGLKAGDRRMLDYSWCRDLVREIRANLSRYNHVSGEFVGVLCTLFDKSGASNWGVAPHRDLCVPVRERFQRSNWENWTVKQGIPHAQPPPELLRSMFAVRLNIDPSDSDNGALLVAPASHRSDGSAVPATVIDGLAGSALLMSPLLVHASRRSKSGGSRRVLQFLFGPRELPRPAQWYYAV